MTPKKGKSETKRKKRDRNSAIERKNRNERKKWSRWSCKKNQRRKWFQFYEPTATQTRRNEYRLIARNR